MYGEEGEVYELASAKDLLPLFFDGDHLSAYGNMVIFPDFTSFIEKEEIASLSRLKINSNENNIVSDDQFLRDIYKKLLDREVDPQGLQFFIRYLDAGKSREDVIFSIRSSVEFKNNSASNNIL